MDTKQCLYGSYRDTGECKRKIDSPKLAKDYFYNSTDLISVDFDMLIIIAAHLEMLLVKYTDTQPDFGLMVYFFVLYPWCESKIPSAHIITIRNKEKVLRL